MNQTAIEAMTAFHRHELMLDTRDEDLKWENWTNAVEKLLGHDLDGDQEVDGYSLDRAFDFYSDGLSPEDAHQEFRTIAA